MNILKKIFTAAFILLVTFLLPGQVYGVNGSIYGTITDQNGDPLEGASIRLGRNGSFVVTATSAADGTYSMPSIPAATYRITTILDNYARSGTTITMIDNISTQINFRLIASTSTVSGNIYDTTTGLGIPNADVAFNHAETHETIETTADGNGDFSINTLEPGTYTIAPSASGYQTGSVGLVIEAGTDYTDQYIGLAQNPGTLEGTVSQSGGGVITSGFINYYPKGIGAQAVQLSGTGTYSISDLAIGTFNVVAVSDGYITKAGTAVITTGGTTTLDFELELLPGAVSGTVKDSDGVVVEGARVDVLDNNVNIGVAITDASGAYSIAGLAAGSHTLQVSKTNYILVSQSVSITTNTLTTVNVELTLNPQAQTNGILGTVSDATTGLPISGGIVSIKIGSQLTVLALTGINGGYAFYDLPPGNYSVTAGADNYQTAVAAVTVVSMQNTQQDFTLLGSPGIVTGKITDSGLTGIDFATVNLVQGGHLIATAYTDASGDYTISLVAPGTYSVQASKTGFQTKIDESVAVTDGGTTTVDLTLASIPDTVVGVVTSSVTGDAIPDAIVQLNPSTGTLLQTAFTGITGTYNFGGLTGGTYTISADAPNYFANESASFTVVSDGASEEVTINIVLTPLDFSPQTVVGSVVVNSFLLQDDRVHRLTWFASIVPTVGSYRIERNGTLIANIIADKQYFIYDDHNRSPLQLDAYVITAINFNGDESATSTIMLQ